MFSDLLNKIVNNLVASLVFFPLGLIYAVLNSKGIEHIGISIGLFVCGVAVANITLKALERKAISRSKISQAIPEYQTTFGQESQEPEAFWNVPPKIDSFGGEFAIDTISQIHQTTASISASIAILIEGNARKQEPHMKILTLFDNASANVQYLWGTPLPFSIAGN